MIPASQISVLLAEDNAVVREGLRELLEIESDIKVVGEAEDGHQAVELAKQLRPDVVVMDISMPRLSGLEATQRILRTAAAPKILVLSANNEAAYVERVKSLGASGYVLKSASYALLPDTIRKVHQGSPFFGPQRPLRP